MKPFLVVFTICILVAFTQQQQSSSEPLPTSGSAQVPASGSRASGSAQIPTSQVPASGSRASGSHASGSHTSGSRTSSSAQIPTSGSMSKSSSTSQIPKKTSSDIILVVDQSALTLDSIMNWISNDITALQQLLVKNGIGNMANNDNLFGLVLFGGAQGSYVATQQLLKATDFVNALAGIKNNIDQSQGIADGYDALNLALSCQFRPEALHIVIFISPRSLQIGLDCLVTKDILVTKIQQLGVILNVIVNTNFAIDNINLPQSQMNNLRALGVVFMNHMRSIYYSNESMGANNLQNMPGGLINAENSASSTVDDYVELVEEVNNEDCVNINQLAGGAFDINVLLSNPKLFTTVLNYAKLFEALSVMGLSPQPIPPTTPTQPVTQPITQPTCPFPTGSYGIFDGTLYSHNTTLMTLSQANQFCTNAGGLLLDVDEDNSDFLTQLVGKNIVWANSWDTDNYSGEPISFFHGSITLRSNANDLLQVVCEFTPPLVGC